MHDWQSAEMSSVGISNRFRTYSRDIVVGVRVHFVPRDGLGVLRRRGPALRADAGYDVRVWVDLI